MRPATSSLAVARQVVAIVAVFVLIVAVLLGLAYMQMSILSAVRAYVGGEALWSKGQKDAVDYLRRYAESRDERDFARYRAALAVPLGDRDARLELEKPRPDPRVVHDGFVRGRNHPDDVPGMMWLFRRFRRVHYLAHAIDVWATADHDIARIRRVGALLRADARPRAPAIPVSALLRKVTVLNERLTPLEEEFSRTLGMGARRTGTLLLRGTFVAAGVLLSLGLLLSAMMLRRLRGWETRYRHLLNSASDAIVIADRASGRILEANRRAADLVGTPAEQLVGTLQARLHPDDEQGSYAAFEEELRAGRPGTTALHIRHADGHLVPVEMSAAVTEVEGTLVIQSIVRDVTERRQAERELRRALAREREARADAEHANRVKDDFLSVLSHELRTPLTPVLAWARVLQRTPGDQDAMARGLQAIERSARAQARLIEDLLDVSRIIAGKFSLTLGPVDLARVVEAAAEGARLANEPKKMRFEMDLDPAVGIVEGDAGRLQQVVSNLLGNAIKFTHSHGTIRVRLTREADQVELAVSDTGAGIAPGFLPHVFERFRQADSSPTRSHAGLGLGLAIVRHLVELHGGSVTAESAGPGRGATFTVRLPARPVDDVHPAPESAAQRRGRDERPRLERLRILVVEDQDETRELVTLLLEQNGAETRHASSVEDALAVLEQWIPDVLVSDIGMPAADGYALLEAVRARGAAWTGIRAVALTAHARPEDRSRARAAGFEGYVAKPFEPDDLVEEVRRVARA